MATTAKKKVKLVCVTGELNNNKLYEMEENDDGSTFTARWGRVGGPMASKSYPMREWDKIYREKTGKVRNGYIYKDVTELYAEEKPASNGATTVKEMISSGRHSTVRDIVQRLLAYAKRSIQMNYTVSSEAVTQKQVDRAQELLDEIATLGYDSKNVDQINKRLIEFFQVVPRKMKKVQDHLIPLDGKDHSKLFDDIIVNEQNTLDVMAGQVAMQDKDKSKADKPKDKKQAEADILDQMGLELEPVTDPVIIAEIKAKMQSKAKMFKHAFRVVNKKTSSVYETYFAKAANKKTELYWHGSRSENWISIMEKGLLIRPSGAAYSGSMFGDGIYFASEFDKSLGYTSISASRWAGGSANNAFLALYRVHLGKQYVTQSSDYSLSYKRLQSMGSYDSTHGKKGSYLMRDEYIIYQPCQCTIEYLVEVEGSQHS